MYWVTLPAAFVMFCWDLWFGWQNKEHTRTVARQGREHARKEAMTKREKAEEDKQAKAEEQGQITSTNEKPTASLPRDVFHNRMRLVRPQFPKNDHRWHTRDGVRIVRKYHSKRICENAGSGYKQSEG